MSVIDFFSVWTFDALAYLASVEKAEMVLVLSLRCFKYVTLLIQITTLEANTIIVSIFR